MEYLLDLDYNNNFYIIPENRLVDWIKWLEINDDVYNPDIPSYANPVGYDITRVRFKKFRII